MKKTLPSILLGSLLLASAPTLVAHASTTDRIGLTINNKVVHFETMPIQQNDRVLVPLRAICEAIGATVAWDANTSTATITRDHDTIQMTLSSTTAKKNDQSVVLDIAPQLIDNATMIPVRFLVEGLGLQAKWEENTKTVIIDTRPASDASLPSANKPTQTPLTTKQIAQNFDRVVMINIYDKNGKLLGSGSGMVISEDGKILTNHHVLAEGTTAKVVFQDQTTFTASKVLLDDPDRDLALMQINVSNLPTVKFGDSNLLEIGDNVVAIGSPLGMQNTLSSGLISGLHRIFPLDKMRDVEFLQTNAPYTFGSSGGALFNMYGEVIGVTSNAAAFVGGELNFAIPSNDVTRFLKQPLTPMSFPEFELRVHEQQMQEMEHGSTDPYEDEELDEEEAAFKTASEVRKKLRATHPTYTIPGTDKTLKLDYFAMPSDDNKNQDINVYLDDYSMLDEKGQLKRQEVANLLKVLTQYAREAGATNPLITLRLSYESTTYNKSISTEYQTYNPRKDKFIVDSYKIGWALLNDATNTITYGIDPNNDMTKQTTPLN